MGGDDALRVLSDLTDSKDEDIADAATEAMSLAGDEDLDEDFDPDDDDEDDDQEDEDKGKK